MPRLSHKTLRIFCSYSHKDELYLDELRTGLRSLERQGLIEWWHDRQIVPGWEWDEAIDKNLNIADIVLLLVTPDFIASDYVFEKEVEIAIERHERGEARVIPIIVRPTLWSGTVLDKLQALPKDAKPITQWRNRDEAWLDVVSGIRKVIEDLRAEPATPDPVNRYALERRSDEVLYRYREGVEAVWADEVLSRLEAEYLKNLSSRLGMALSDAAYIERIVMGETREVIFERQEHAPGQRGSELRGATEADEETGTSGVPRRLRAFLCHSSTDKPVVRALYRRLRDDGIAPWLDEEDLVAGQAWQQEIPKAVRRSDVVIVCLSRASITKAGYVQKEIRQALDVAEEQPEESIYVIPLRLEEVQGDEIPERLREYHWVNYFEERGYTQLKRALQARAKQIGLNWQYQNRKDSATSVEAETEPRVSLTEPPYERNSEDERFSTWTLYESVHPPSSTPAEVEVPVEQHAPQRPDVLSPETIFISYDRDDWDEFVQPLVIDLRQRGLKVWIDQLFIRRGAVWSDEIQEALETCERMVLCVSPNSMQSPQAKNEYRSFLRMNKTVIPLVLRETRTPYDLASIQFVSYEDRDLLIQELLTE